MDNNIGATPGDQVALEPAGQSEQTVVQQIGQTQERVVLQPAGERVETIEGPFVAEPNAVVQEVQALEGFELPPGQVPEGLVQV